MTTTVFRAWATALTLLAASQAATAQVYLSDYLGAPTFNGCTFTANAPFVTSLTAGNWGVGIDTAHTFANEQPIEFRGRPLYRKGIGMNPGVSGGTPYDAVVEFDLDAIRAVNTEPIDVFEATVGIYSRQGGHGAQFRVYLDGDLRETVDIAGVDGDAVTLRIPVVQAGTLRLETGIPGTVGSNQACWGDAVLAASETSILSWGSNSNGQNHVPALPSITQVASGGGHSLALLSDGTIVATGNNFFGQIDVPDLPTGLKYVEVAAGVYHSVARRSDGTVVAWGDNTYGQIWSPGGSFVEIAAGGYHCLARRANGTVVTWGDNLFGALNVPPLPAGVTYVEISAGSSLPGGGGHSVARRSDGSVIAWGNTMFGQHLVPSLPAGVSYVEIASGPAYSLARRSDGEVVAWGSMTSVPALPTGLTYVEIAAGNGALARRSDGSVVGWGGGSVPALPAGSTYVEIAAGGSKYLARRDDGELVGWGAADIRPTFTRIDASNDHALALRSDGHVSAWGENTNGELDVPPLPASVSYTDVGAGFDHSVALRSDGEIEAWGDNGGGQLNVPALPAGLTYVDVAAGRFHSLALRSDGSAVAWGANASGQSNLPALPAGLTWLAVDGGGFWSLGLVSDGTLRAWGSDSDNQVSQLPAGNDFVEIAAAFAFGAARRADGTIVSWGNNQYGQAVAPGGAYRQIAAGWVHGLGLRNDGELVAWGASGFSGQTNVSQAPPNSEYVQISASSYNSYALAERRAMVETYGVGCSFEGSPNSVYESMQMSAFDLDNRAFRWVRTQNGYGFNNASGAQWYQPSATAQPVAPLQLDGQQQFTLSAPMPVPGGTTTVLNVTTKGQVEIGGESAPFVDYTPTPAELLANPRTVFALWHDYDQTIGGSIRFEEVGGLAIVTFDSVRSYSPSTSPPGTTTFQFQFDIATGDVILLMLSHSTSTNTVVIGYSHAGPSTDPGPSNLSLSNVPPELFDNTPGLELAAIGGEPTLGNQNFAVQVSNVPSLVPLAFVAYSATAIDPGIDLTVIGMPGCFGYTSPDIIVSVGVDPATGVGVFPRPIPASAAVIGTTRALQALAFSLATPLNLITSNGVRYTVNF